MAYQTSNQKTLPCTSASNCKDSYGTRVRTRVLVHVYCPAVTCIPSFWHRWMLLLLVSVYRFPCTLCIVLFAP